MRKPRTVLMALIGFLCLGVAGESQAFNYGGAARCCDTIYFRVEQKPLLPDPLLTCGSTAPAGWFKDLIDQAAANWNAEGTAFQLVDIGPTLTSCGPSGGTGNCVAIKDDQNTVSLGASCTWVDNNVLAFATRWFFVNGPSAGCVTEVDICFNTNRNWYTNSGPCSGSCFDVVSVALHEFGHWISSGHENDVAALGYTPVMYQSTTACGQRRFPTADERALIHWAYDANGTIRLPERQTAVHLHPTDANYNTPPPRVSCGWCQCPCPANPECESDDADILDVIATIDIAFRGGTGTIDPNCPVGRSDVDCSGTVDILDVTRLVSVAFRSGDPAAEFCDPCG